MIQLTMDSHGFLTSFEAIPQQVAQSSVARTPPDWGSMFTLAGVDPLTLQVTEPQWRWLASPDTRAAWTGTWPGRNRPLQVEAAALEGKPVALQLIGPWVQPSRTASTDTDGDAAILLIYFALLLVVVIGGSILAAKNLREGRGDRRGALSLAAAVTGLLWVLWLCQVHVSPAPGMIGSFLVAIVTTVFYGVLFWAIYLALEPFVRRHWPQTLMSWTTLLGGRLRDPIVGRDVLAGVAVGALIALLIQGVAAYGHEAGWADTSALEGVRASHGRASGESVALCGQVGDVLLLPAVHSACAAAQPVGRCVSVRRHLRDHQCARQSGDRDRRRRFVHLFLDPRSRGSSLGAHHARRRDAYRQPDSERAGDG
jgi:hypothetical protein